MLYNNGKPVKDCYLGDKPVREIYRGTTLVWSKEMAREWLTREEEFVMSEASVIDPVHELPRPTYVQIPPWARAIRYVLLGGGGGGSGGDPIGLGDTNGGGAAQFVYGEVLIDSAETSLWISVGAGGEAGNSGADGNSGGTTQATILGTRFESAGGVGGTGYGDPTGKSAGSLTRWGRTFQGGGVAQQTEPGRAPGGGGGAASKALIGRRPGGKGGDGCVWLVFAALPWDEMQALEVGDDELGS